MISSNSTTNSSTNTTALCPNECIKDALIDVDEIPIGENSDIKSIQKELIDTNGTHESTPTSELSIITNATTPSPIATTQKNTKQVIDAERPIELKEISPSQVAPTSTYLSGSTSENNVLAKAKEDVKDPTPSEVDASMSSLPLSSSSSNAAAILPDAQSTAFIGLVDSTVVTATVSNDINGVYSKKIQTIISTDENENGENVNVLAVAAAAVVASQSQAASLTPIAPSPNTNECFNVKLFARFDTFNVSLGTDDICLNAVENHGFNVTYHIPVSKHMKENHFNVIFV